MEELARWIERAARGDEEGYRELYRRYRPALRRLCAGFSALDADEVEDVVQESFVRAFKALPRLKAASAFEPWILSIARNRALSCLERKNSSQRVRDELFRESPPELPTAIPSSLQLERETQVVRQMIAELPEGAEKHTVQLFYVEGECSAREIAEKLGVGKSAVTMRLERFRAKVKRELLRRVIATRLE